MRIKHKPKKPIRKKNIKDWLGELYFPRPLSVNELSTYIDKYIDDIFKQDYLKPFYSQSSYKDFHLQIGYDGTEIIGIRDESEEEYSKRLVKYKVKLAEYNVWYKINKIEIERELKQRKQQKEKEKISKIQELEKQLKKLKNENQSA